MSAATGEAALEMVAAKRPDLVIMDVRLPGMSGLEAFLEMKRIDSKIPVIVMTAFGTTDTAIEATKMGAFDYVLKPFEIPEMLSLIDRAMESGRFMRAKVEVDPSSSPWPTGEALVGRSKAMQEVYKAIGRVAPTDATVLIRGESGTGKELVARAIYQHSSRADRPFLVINCVAIPETLLESELFGYERGAFTGAISRRVGKIEQANRGTIFLDEIGDMPFSVQSKILRLLQERSIERLGGREPIPVDVRIIAATNRDLERAMEEGKFREDLYYRLNVVTLWLPPLRERLEDIPLLAQYFLARFSREMGIPNLGLTRDALKALQAHTWPGNVRELANTLQKALIFSRGAPISAQEVIKAITGAEVPEKGPEDVTLEEAIRAWIRKALVEGPKEGLFEGLSDMFASMVIKEALNLTGGNRSKAAKLLGLSRPTLQAKIEKYGLKLQTTVKD